jgi:hypothetical protein
MTFPQCIPLPPTLVYVPRVFGFRIRREPIEDETSSTSSASSSASAAATGGAASKGTDKNGVSAASSKGAATAIRSIGPAGVSALKDGSGRRKGYENSASASTTTAAATGGSSSGAKGAAQQPARELTTVLPRDAQGRVIGRDGKVLTAMEDAFDEEDGKPVQRSATGGTEAAVGDEEDEEDEDGEGEGEGDGIDPRH